MATSNSSRTCAQFDRFSVDLSSGELRKSGFRVAIQEQPLQVLRLLLQAEGEVVNREQLCATLWPDGTFVDFEHGVNTAVKKTATGTRRLNRTSQVHRDPSQVRLPFHCSGGMGDQREWQKSPAKRCAAPSTRAQACGFPTHSAAAPLETQSGYSAHSPGCDDVCSLLVRREYRLSPHSIGNVAPPGRGWTP